MEPGLASTSTALLLQLWVSPNPHQGIFTDMRLAEGPPDLRLTQAGAAGVVLQWMGPPLTSPGFLGVWPAWVFSRSISLDPTQVWISGPRLQKPGKVCK